MWEPRSLWPCSPPNLPTLRYTFRQTKFTSSTEWSVGLGMRDPKSNSSTRRIRFSTTFAVFLFVTIFWMKESGELEGFGVVEAGILTVAFAGVAVALWIWARSGRKD